jgi:adenylylsulfate kinase-like enzyme
MKAPSIPTVVITGTIGSGKTVLAADLGEVLAERGRTVAVIDLDWLGWLARPTNVYDDVEALIIRNLQEIWPNFLEAGADCFVLARVIQTQGHVDDLRRALPNADITVARVVSAPETVAERLSKRDTGAILEGHLKESLEFDAILEKARLEDHRVVNDERPLRAVTLELLDTLGW